MGNYIWEAIASSYKKLEQLLGDLIMLAAKNPQGSPFTPSAQPER